MTPKIEGAVAKAVNYEVAIADMARRSERRAWMVAFTAIFMSLILAGGYFYMLPLKEKVPFLVVADAYTGNAAVARLDESFKDRSITASEAINRSSVAHYVMMREAYDHAFIRLRDWRAVHSMSGPEVAAAYNALYAANNQDNPDKTYGQARSIRIRILSVVFLGGGDGTTPKGATVRFQRSVYEKRTGVTRPLDSKIATMEFNYNFKLKMSEPDRIENPLGFQVTSYRTDNDFAALPPLETEEATLTSPAPASALPTSDAASLAQSAPLESGTEQPRNPAQVVPESSDNATGASAQ